MLVHFAASFKRYFLLLSYDLQELLKALFPKIRLPIHDQAGDAHNVVFLLHVRIVREIIHIDRDMVIICSDPFGSGNEIRTHGTRERNRNIYVNIARNPFYALLQGFSHILPGTCRIVECQNKGIKFMPAGNTVKTESQILSFRAADRNGNIRIPLSHHFIGKCI